MATEPSDTLADALASKATRIQLLEHTVEKRIANLTYLRRFFDDGSSVMWMNVVRITRADLDTHFASNPSVTHDRLYGWFALGLSLAGLLSLQNGRQFVNVVSTLLNEWEYQTSSGVGRMLKDLKTKTARRRSVAEATADPPGLPASASFASNEVTAEGTESTPTPGHSPSNHGGVTGKHTVHKYLCQPSVPTSLCYAETILCLCDVLLFIYRKFLDYDSEDLRKVIDIDKKLKHHFFGLLSRELEIVAEERLRRVQVSLGMRFEGLTSPEDRRKAGRGTVAPLQGAHPHGTMPAPLTTFGSGVLNEACLSGSDDDDEPASGHRRITDMPVPLAGTPSASPL